MRKVEASDEEQSSDSHSDSEEVETPRGPGTGKRGAKKIKNAKYYKQSQITIDGWKAQLQAPGLSVKAKK